MSLSAAELSLLLNSAKRECQVRYWLFDPPTVSPGISPAGNTDLSSNVTPVAAVSPRYSLLLPGETVTLYGSDSFERGGGPVTGHTWTLIAGTAVLTPVGDTCLVTPQTPDEVVTVRLTVTGSNALTQVTHAYVVASTLGWVAPSGALDLSGGYPNGGWRGSLTIEGDSVDVSALAKDKLLLVHIDTLYDGAPLTLGGYRRANNLALLRVLKITHGLTHTDGHAQISVDLGPPDQILQENAYWAGPAETDGAARGLVFERNSTGSGFNYQGAGGSPDGIIYESDFRLTDAALWIATDSNIVQEMNLTLFHDPNQFGANGAYLLPVTSIWEQIKSTLESILCLAFVDYMGALRLIPSPSVRADEWWGTPDPRWPSGTPLSPDYVLDYEILYNDETVDQVVLKGYDDENLPVTVSTGGSRTLRLEPYDGYVITNLSAAAQWAVDLLAMHNREWDLTVTLSCIGNLLNVGDFTYVNFPPPQPGLAAATGLAYVNDIRHALDHNTNMQVTVASLSQITSWGV